MPDSPGTAVTRVDALVRPTGAGRIMVRLVELLVLCGAASLIYYRPVSSNGVIDLHTITYRSDFLFLAAEAVAAVVIVPCSPQWRRLTLWEKTIAGALATYLLSALAATLFSAVRHQLWFNFLGAADLLKTLVGISLVVVVYPLAKTDPGFARWLILALSIPPIIPLAMGLLSLANPPTYHMLFGELRLLEPDGYRFQGLTSNPSQAAVSSAVAMSLVWPRGHVDFVLNRWWPALVSLTYTGGLAYAIFWSVTRGVLFVLPLLLIGGLIAAYRRVPRRRACYLGAALAFILIAAPIVLLPPPHSAAFLDARLRASDVRLFDAESTTAARHLFGRPQIWHYYLEAALANPLGVGFNYEQRYSFKNPYQSHVNAQNNLLAAWMYGGVLGAASLLVIFCASMWAIVDGFRRARSLSAYVAYLGVVMAFLVIWGVSVVSGTPIGDYLHSLLLVLVLIGPAAYQSGAAGGEASR